MRRALVAVLTAMLMAFTMAPSSAHHHRKTEDPVTNAEYKELQVGWTKVHIQTFVNQDGTRTLSWTEGADSAMPGQWIQKQYVGKPLDDQFNTETTVFINYRLEGDYYVSHYMTRCIWNGLNAWNCGQVKTDLT